MKQKIYLHIPEPCYEDWHKMSPVQQGRFCNSCSKQVVDFSQLSDKQILAELSKTAGKTCGKFSSDQLQRPIVPEAVPSPIPYKFFLSAFIPAFLFGRMADTKAQAKAKMEAKTELAEIISMGYVTAKIAREVKITGTVKNREGEPLSSVSVFLKGSKNGTATDEEGNFSLKTILGEKPVLQISYVGYNMKEVELKKDETKPLEIVLTDNDKSFLGDVVVVVGNYRHYSNTDVIEDELQEIEPVKKVGYKGVVVNEAGDPVPYATIKFNARKGVIADSTGRFEFEASPYKKRVSLEVSSVGYQSKATKIELTGVETDPITIALNNNILLDEVAVKCFAGVNLTGIMGGLSTVRSVTIRDTANTFIQKVFKNEMFKAFPNPAQKGSSIKLSFKKSGDYEVQLFDNSGKLYLQKSYLNLASSSSVNLQLPVSLSAGQYYLKAIDTKQNKMFVDKLFVR